MRVFEVLKCLQVQFHGIFYHCSAAAIVRRPLRPASGQTCADEAPVKASCQGHNSVYPYQPQRKHYPHHHHSHLHTSCAIYPGYQVTLKLPGLREQGFLGAALLVEGLLFGFHLKGSALDWRLHFLLVLVILLSSLVTWAEVAQPQSLLLSSLRAQLTMLQGVWFCQIAQILFRRDARRLLQYTA